MPDEPVERDEEEPGISRRKVLKIGAAAAGGVALGGAAGFFGGAASRDPDIASLNQRLAAITKVLNLPPLASSIAMYNWSFYTNFALLDTFEKRFGVTLQYDDTAETEDNFRTALKTGNPGKFDIMVVTDYAVKEAIDLGHLAKLNHDYIPNIDLLDQNFPTSWDPNHEYSLPYLWGTTGVGWNTTAATFPAPETKLHSWNQIFDTAAGSFLRRNFRKVTIQADRDEALAATAIHLGKDINDLSPATLQEVENKLKAVKPYLAQFADATTYGAGLADDSFVASHAWSGDVLFVREATPKPEITYTVPDEGVHLWTDNYVIPKNAPNRDTAMVFINFMWEAANAAVLAMFRNYMIANKLSVYGGPRSQAKYKSDLEPFGMILPHVLTLPDYNPFLDPATAPKVFRTRARTEAENTTLQALWERVQAA